MTEINPEAFSSTDSRLAATTIKKLADAGITTMEQLAYTTPRELVDLTGIGIDTAEKAIALSYLIASPGYITAEELHNKQVGKPKCSTGSEEFDRILGGGIQVGAITELIGEYASAKTQTCFTLSVIAPHMELGGFGKDVVYIDTEGTFETERVMQIAEARGVPKDEALRHIIWARAYSSNHQVTLIDHLDKIISENDICMIIVDSMMAHLRSEYLGRAMLAERQQKLGKMLGKLLRIASGNNVAVVLTNQVISTPDSFYGGDPNKPTGGNIMAHACTYRVKFQKGRKNTRLVQVIDSSWLPDEKIRIAITEKGIEDADG